MLFKGVSFGSLIIFFLIFVIFFGTKRLRDMGHDLGEAIKNFKKGLEEEAPAKDPKE